jgi:hypothetical protein
MGFGSGIRKIYSESRMQGSKRHRIRIRNTDRTHLFPSFLSRLEPVLIYKTVKEGVSSNLELECESGGAVVEMHRDLFPLLVHQHSAQVHSRLRQETGK